MVKKYKPFVPIHPGEVIKDEVEARGITQKQLAGLMGMPYTMLNEILNGKRNVTTETALLFEAALDINAEMLLGIQADYSLQIARKNRRLLKHVAAIRAAILVLIAVLMPSVMSAQYAYSGMSGVRSGYIYEDGIMDDGTRYIISDMYVCGQYSYSLCKYVAEDGNSWYGIAVEAKQYIPKNGLLVFVGKGDNGSQSFVLGQKLSDHIVMTKNSVGISPIFFFGRIGLTTYQQTSQSEISYAVFDLSEENLEQLLSAELKEIRISNRSTYNSTSGRYYLDGFPKWLSRAKGNVDARSSVSVNTILEDID